MRSPRAGRRTGPLPLRRRSAAPAVRRAARFAAHQRHTRKAARRARAGRGQAGRAWVRSANRATSRICRAVNCLLVHVCATDDARESRAHGPASGSRRSPPRRAAIALNVLRQGRAQLRGRRRGAGVPWRAAAVRQSSRPARALRRHCSRRAAHRRARYRRRCGRSSSLRYRVLVANGAVVARRRSHRGQARRRQEAVVHRYRARGPPRAGPFHAGRLRGRPGGLAARGGPVPRHDAPAASRRLHR